MAGPGRGEALSQAWRAKQLEYAWLRAMSGRYKPFWDITRDALRHVAARDGLALDAEREAVDCEVLDLVEELAPGDLDDLPAWLSAHYFRWGDAAREVASQRG